VGDSARSAHLDARVGVGLGTATSYGAQADAAVNAGATTAEIVDMLVGVVPIVGLPCMVAAAPKLAMALGYDTDDALEPQSSERARPPTQLLSGFMLSG
jgi:4-carboxymuconolactone decarboxylase